MKQRSMLFVKLLLVLSFLVSILSGCGTPPDVKSSYPLESVNRMDNASSYVYRAENKSVPIVAQELAADTAPDEMSKDDTERMFLVYGDDIYHLQQDPEKPEDTLVEISSREYVRQNYDSSFLQGYLTAVLIGNLFDALDGRGGGYRGYTSREVYQPKAGTYKVPTADDKKLAPPLTSDRSGKITRRGQDSVGSSGSIFKRPSDNSSKGTISRDKSSGSSGGGLFSPPKRSYTKPKTSFGSGKIGRRGRR
ncbi:DUF4247 domain-containing protein [Paenibacillus sp. F411]|uniref:DUF4247 domain-containing protein n=1 Tax=Paenibacillus sp. F411 TaxID=2820239 RepID=UPI001AAF9790|nr:DUF4247 domain-containing protein [Paenibacillus sp. F411]MBO2942986.1 DUF4247 domain-containing protein [Paenibacillus sp. F411]